MIQDKVPMIEKVRNDIHQSLCSIVKDLDGANLDASGPGLMFGKSGVALFYFYYSRFSKEPEYARKGMKLIVEVFDFVNKGNDFHTFCDGIGGFAWTVEHLVRNGFIHKDDVPFLNQLDHFLYNKMLTDAKNGDYDFLHAAMGIGLYLLSRSHISKCRSYVLEFIELLESNAIDVDQDFIKWNSPCGINNGEIGTNIGLSHGMSGVISFLCKAHSVLSPETKIESLLQKSVNYIISKQNNYSITQSYFPSYLTEANEKIGGKKYGWCYGDTGIASAIYRAGEVTSNLKWKQLGKDVFVGLGNTPILSDDIPLDAGICHGSAGVAHMFNKMYLRTGAESLQAISFEWFKETLRKASLTERPQYKSYSPDCKTSRDDNGLLRGIAGIGLTFITALSGISNWDECLLLS
jgi:lantibiotic modifying enzyme